MLLAGFPYVIERVGQNPLVTGLSVDRFGGLASVELGGPRGIGTGKGCGWVGPQGQITMRAL
jgi:hypothetical protein